MNDAMFWLHKTPFYAMILFDLPSLHVCVARYNGLFCGKIIACDD
jgi:hypothetical protein